MCPFSLLSCLWAEEGRRRRGHPLHKATVNCGRKSERPLSSPWLPTPLQFATVNLRRAGTRRSNNNNSNVAISGEVSTGGGEEEEPRSQQVGRGGGGGRAEEEASSSSHGVSDDFGTALGEEGRGPVSTDSSSSFFAPGVWWVECDREREVYFSSLQLPPPPPPPPPPPSPRIPHPQIFLSWNGSDTEAEAAASIQANITTAVHSNTFIRGVYFCACAKLFASSILRPLAHPDPEELERNEKKFLSPSPLILGE